MSGRSCEGCGWRLRFAIGPNEKVIPLSRVKSLYVIENDGMPLLKEVAIPIENLGPLNHDTVGFRDQGVYVNHFEICPERERFKR